MVYSGTLTLVGIDGVGFIDCPDLPVLHSMRIRDLNEDPGASPESLNGRRVQFEMSEHGAVNINLEAEETLKAMGAPA